MLRFLFVLCMTVVLNTDGNGQQQHILLNQLTLEEGLSQTTNSYLFKDAEGFVWISSIAGLNRFDGNQIKVYTPDRNDSCAIRGENIQSNFFEDVDGNIWFSTFEAINCYTRKTDCFSHFNLNDVVGESTVGYKAFYLDADNDLWLVIGNNIYTFNSRSHQFTHIHTLGISIHHVFPVSNHEGRLVKIVTHERFAFNVEVMDVNSTTHPLVVKDELKTEQLCNLKAMGFFIDGDSILWVLSDNKIIRTNWESPNEKVLEMQGILSVNGINDSTLLLGFEDKGFMVFDKKKFAITASYSLSEKTATGLISDKINMISITADQEVWLSSYGLGLSYFVPESNKFKTKYFRHLQTGGLQSFLPTSIVPIQNDTILCFSADENIYQFNMQNHEFHFTPTDPTKKPDLPGKVFNSHRDRNNRIWILTWQGLVLYHPESSLSISITDSQLIPIGICGLSDGRMLLSPNQGGLYELKESQDLGYVLEPIAAVSDTEGYYPIWQDPDDRIWINRDLQEFIVLDPVRFDTIKRLDITGICQKIIASSDQQTIWIASSSGLYEVDANTLSIVKNYNKDYGMPASGFNTMVMDKHGTLWLAHNNGIISFNTATKEHIAFTKEDGLSSFEYSTTSYQFDDGEIWFGAAESYTNFNPDEIKLSQIKAYPQISSILINDKPPATKLICETTKATNETEIQKLTFDYKHNTISLVLTALEYSAPHLNKVKYQMEGMDDGELESPSGTLVRYPNMAPGSYRLKVYAANADGVYNPDPRILVIEIIPPYYQTWWFRLLVAFLVIGIIAYIIYLRFSKSLELQRVRLKLYENLHDDVGSRLTAIVLSAEDLERNENIRHPKLTGISTIARSIVGNMRRLVWAIDPENDKMSNLVQKISHDKSQLLDDAISFQIEMDSNLKNVSLAGEVRYQISSICNEAFTNISKYAKASHVMVKISKENGYLKLYIKDDGIGFNADQQNKNAITGSGYGLANMKRRASRVGGQFNLLSAPGQGTIIDVKFPFR